MASLMRQHACYPTGKLRLLAGVALLLQLMSACSEDKKVAVSNPRPSSSNLSTAEAMSIAVFNPGAPDPTPTKEFVAPLGSDISLSVLIKGIDAKNASVGYSSSLAGITINATTLTIRSPREGDFKIVLILRDIAKCKAQGYDDKSCNLAGRAVREDVQAFDASETILLSVMDPKALGGDPSKNCQGGSGMFDDIICKRGLIGSLVGVLMPGGIGGMVGGLGGTTPTTGTATTTTTPTATTP